MSKPDQWRLVSPSELTDEVVEMFSKENEGKPDDGFKHISEFIPEVLEQLGHKAPTTRARARNWSQPC